MYSVKKIMEQAGSESILFAHKASNLLENKIPQDALRLCEEGVKRFPFYAEGHFVLGRCYQGLDRNEEAKAEYERTLFYMPGHIKALKALAYIFYKNKLREAGNALLITNTLYEPFNEKLAEFLKSEGIYDTRLQQARPDADSEDNWVEIMIQPPGKETSEIIPEITILPAEQVVPGEDTLVKESPQRFPVPETFPADADSLNRMDITTQTLPATESEAILKSDIIAGKDAEFIEVIPEQALTEEPMAQTPAGEDWILPPEGEIDASGPQFASEAEKDLSAAPAGEEPLLGSSVAPEAEYPPPENFASPELPEDIDSFNEWANKMIQSAHHDQEKYEINNIVQNIEESSFEEDKLDLSQFANVQDDFSTLITDLFHTPPQSMEEDTPNEMVPPTEEGETELLAEERPIPEKAPLSTLKEEDVVDKPLTDDESGNEQQAVIQFAQKKTAQPPASPNFEEWMAKAEQEARLEQDAAALKISAFIDQKKSRVVEKKFEPPVGEELQPERAPTLTAEKYVTELAESSEQLYPVAGGEETLSIEQVLENPSLLTPTFGEILIAQRKFEDARQVFCELAKRDPQNMRLKKKIEFLDKMINVQK